MNGHGARLSDRERSRQVAERLWTASMPSPMRTRPRKPKPYVAFKAESALLSTTAHLDFRGSSPFDSSGDDNPITPIPDSGFHEWEELLRWFRESCHAQVSFILDAQGFIIEYDGSFSYDEIEDLGSQMMVIMNRADQTETAGPTRSVLLAYDMICLSGMRLAQEGETNFTLVVVTPAPLPPQRFQEIVTLAQESIHCF